MTSETVEDRRRMAEGCCSAVSPCSHQQRDPYSICEVCRQAAGDAPPSSPVADAVGQAPTLSSGEDLAGLSARARELLAEEYERPGIEGPYPTYADLARRGSGSFTMCSIRAVERALKEGRSGNLIPRTDTPSPDAPAQARVPSGWKLVPIEPTDEMHSAFERAYWQKSSDAASPTPTEFPDDGGGPFGYGYRAALSAAPAAPQDETAGAEGWQPIETAPRDGTRFWALQLTRDEAQQQFVCWWQEDFTIWTGWQDNWDTDPFPTHWRPLPPPPSLPAQTQTSQGGDR